MVGVLEQNPALVIIQSHCCFWRRTAVGYADSSDTGVIVVLHLASCGLLAIRRLL